MKKIMMFIVTVSVFMFISACGSDKTVKKSENIEDKIMKAVVNVQTLAGIIESSEEEKKAGFSVMLTEYKEGKLSEKTIDCMIMAKTSEDVSKCE